jgi:hypothetical protein
MYEDYEAMKAAIASVAKNIAKSGSPKMYSPMVNLRFNHSYFIGLCSYRHR